MAKWNEGMKIAKAKHLDFMCIIIIIRVVQETNILLSRLYFLFSSKCRCRCRCDDDD